MKRRAMTSSVLTIVGSALGAGPAVACADVVLPLRPDISVEARQRREIYSPMVVRVACEHGVSPLLLDALVIQESRYNPRAISSAGAIGLGQLMPGTARMLGVNPYDPADNLRGAARYLRQQLDEFGSVKLALAAYNAGPGRVRRYGRVPSIPETINYVATIEGDLRRTARWPRPDQRRPAVVVNLNAQPPQDSVNVVESGGEAVEVSVERAPPPHWDVFARFAFEQAAGVQQERTE